MAHHDVHELICIALEREGATTTSAAIELLCVLEMLTRKMPHDKRIMLAEQIRNAADRVEHRRDATERVA
jgi:hypothetical protein